ncbi:MAG: hypothetical protein MIO90_05500 [Methanomassiliicoccales archaeon]|nr:hypothetical protein [Methanomassiliicoccales archaeon]
MTSKRRGDRDWLLEGDKVLEHLVRRDLMGEVVDDMELLADPRIKALVNEVADWPWPAITSHKTAGHPLHKFAFLAELKIDLEDRVGKKLSNDLKATLVDGLPRLPTKTPERYGGSGRTELAWSLCDTPLLLYSMSRCFPSFDGSEGLITLSKMSRGSGMPCIVSPELGKFRGPGRKDDPCPLANLYTLRALMQIGPERSEGLARTITESLLSLWKESRERHPYMFFMGTDFRKLKLPFVWYDILSVADALSHCGWVHRDDRFLEMLSVIDAKKNGDGRFKAESVWTSWKGWDFDQKKEPSRWVTFVVERLHRRVENSL